MHPLKLKKMISFIICLSLLLCGYFFYGKLCEKIFSINPAKTTPAIALNDNVDFIPMNPWRIFIIQFLNIAGVGPIFGAIMGAKFGVASFLWITIGCIFIGSVHDFIVGMISIRKNGATLSEIHGDYLGKAVKHIMRIFLVIFLILVGVVFVLSPAQLLNQMMQSNFYNTFFWIIVIFIYYVIATLLPIDKIIGKVYPIFGACLLFMAFAIMGCIFYYHPNIPEIWNGLQNQHPQADTIPIFPAICIIISCGAISGFHATQSPLMARCIPNEKYGRPIFYGSMIAEGIVALIWAAAACALFHSDNSFMSYDAASIVNYIANTWLGKIGAVLAILGIVFAPISSGDTAFRAARIMTAEILKIDQIKISKRLLIAIPMFIIAILFLLYQIKVPDSFAKIWNYFGWGNQVISVVTLWAISVYLLQEKKKYILSLIPAIFLTMAVSSYIFISQKEGFGLSPFISYAIGSGIAIICTFLFFRKKNKMIISQL